MELILSVFAVSILTKVVKKWIAPKWGVLGVQGFVILVSLGTGVAIYAGQNYLSPDFWSVVGTILAGSQAVHTFIFKNLGE